MLKDTAISGHLTGINLSSFLQMIEMEKKTCTIKVFTKKNLGEIFFVNGQLIDAQTVRLKHLDALYDILSWPNTVIEVEDNTTQRTVAIELPLMHILIESARKIDEKPIQDDIDDAEGIDLDITSQFSETILKNSDFCLEIGTHLLIDFDDLVIPFRSTLVGIEKSKYLIVKSPKLFGNVDQELFKIKEMIVKTLYKGTIYAFRSKIIEILPKPSKLMFIEYPNEIEHHELRSHKRYRCNISTETQIQDENCSGVIENISKGGCLCTIETFSTEKDVGSALLYNTVPFRCHFPGSKGEISFMGEIRNTHVHNEKMDVGVKFVYPNDAEEIRTIINDYIQLIQYSGQAV